MSLSSCTDRSLFAGHNYAIIKFVMRGRTRKRPEQLSLNMNTHGGRRAGGRRPGAGRPRKADSGASHLRRPALASRHPVHVTTRLVRLPSLRRRDCFRVVRRALAVGVVRSGFRVVEFSVQSNHIHMLCEATGRRALARGLQGLFSRMARALNRHIGRTGRVFADRYHDRILRAPRQVRNTLLYVLKNCWQHEESVQGPDPYSSAAWFDGWRERLPRWMRGEGASGAARPRTWLLRVGWRRSGLLSPDAIPGAQAP